MQFAYYEKLKIQFIVSNFCKQMSKFLFWNCFTTAPANPVRPDEMNTILITRVASGLVWAIGCVLARSGLAGEPDALVVDLAAKEGVGCHVV
jgi:hypothetical protein